MVDFIFYLVQPVFTCSCIYSYLFTMLMMFWWFLYLLYILWTDFLHCSAVLTVVELTYSNSVSSIGSSSGSSSSSSSGGGGGGSSSGSSSSSSKATLVRFSSSGWIICVNR